MRFLVSIPILVAAAAWAAYAVQAEAPASSLREPLVTRIRLTVPNLTFDQLAAVSTEVIDGRVLSTRAVLPPGGIGYTEAVVRIQNVYKGEPDPEIVVRMLGAESPEHSFVVENQPKLAAGDEAVLFLARGQEAGVFGIVEPTQGVYRIVPQAEGGAARVVVGKYAHGDELAAFDERLHRAIDAQEAVR